MMYSNKLLIAALVSAVSFGGLAATASAKSGIVVQVGPNGVAVGVDHADKPKHPERHAEAQPAPKPKVEEPRPQPQPEPAPAPKPKKPAPQPAQPTQPVPPKPAK